MHRIAGNMQRPHQTLAVVAPLLEPLPAGAALYMVRSARVLSHSSDVRARENQSLKWEAPK
jgi:hypothetical protein